MLWSIPIARIAGTVVRVHVTFLLFLVWIGGSSWRAGGREAAWESVTFMVLLFGCVLAHEFGHIVAARRYGIRTPDVTLWPIGGVASLERIPDNPREELVVALAGPAVNVVIAALLIALMGAAPDSAAMTALENPRAGLIPRLAAANIFLVVFNLIPAFPMDGGRVLRALLALRYGRVRATAIAGSVGQIAAFGFGFIGLVSGNVLLIFIAIFVYLAATAESQAIGLQDAARSLKIRDAMITRFETLGPASRLSDAAAMLLGTTQHEFPIVDGAGRLRGFLTRASLVSGLKERGTDAAAVELMTRDVPEVGENERLSAALELLQKGGGPAVGVIGPDRRLVGYVTIENIGELMMLRSAASR
jgi:Zn-dependent protease/CBS domain-containing protein